MSKILLEQIEDVPVSASISNIYYSFVVVAWAFSLANISYKGIQRLMFLCYKENKRYIKSPKLFN
jgi:hypothetical protein